MRQSAVAPLSTKGTSSHLDSQAGEEDIVRGISLDEGLVAPCSS